MFAVEVESLDKLYRAFLNIACDSRRKPVPDITIAGWGVDPAGSSDRWPFVITKDGVIDNGKSYTTSAERFHETNLRSKTIKPLELFTVLWADKEQPARQIETIFRIRKATPIAGPSLP